MHFYLICKIYSDIFNSLSKLANIPSKNIWLFNLRDHSLFVKLLNILSPADNPFDFCIYVSMII